MNTADQHLRIKKLYFAVCDLPDAAAQRAALAAQAADEATQTELLALLAQAGAQTNFAQPLAQAAERWLDDELSPGDVLGAWTLQASLGQGGMGRVYLAVRSDGHYEQRAALKLLRGWSGAHAAERFTRERQILADLDHPHIARLLDGGTTPRGRPYLVMALVEGQAIDAHCEAMALGLPDRLALFDTLCAAVGHAHRQLVIHCDIKPDNVRVTRDGQAKLLDFGIAQLQGQDDTLGPAYTPGFASPEQLAGQRPGVASDVYGLGRLLEALVKPVAGRHRRGQELVAIVAWATAEKPADRYATVDALQRDVQRLLTHRPVQAMQGGAAYYIGKWLQRRWPWAMAMAAALLMAGGFTWRLAQERDTALAERQRAEREVLTTRETARLLMSLFTGADPKTMDLPSIPKSIPLAAGRVRLQQQMADDPGTRARLQMILGDVYERIGQMPAAAEAFRDVAALYGPEQLGQPLAEAEAQRRLALALNNSLRQADAEAPARRGLALLLQHDPDNLTDIAKAQNRLGISLLNMHQLDEAQTLLQSSFQLRSQVSGQGAEETLSTLHNLARVSRLGGHDEQAESQLRRRLQNSERPLNDNGLGSMEELGTLLSDMQRHGEAEAAAREAVAGWAQRYGADNANVAIGRHKLAYVLRGAGRLGEAQQELQAAWHIETRSHDDNNVRARGMQADMARVHMLAGRLPEAEATWRLAMGVDVRGLPPLALAAWRRDLARTLMWLGRAGEAERLLKLATAAQEKLPRASQERLHSELLRAELALDQRQPKKAAALLTAVEADLPVEFPGLHHSAWALRGRIAAHLGRSADATRWLGQAWQASLAWRGGPHPALLPLGLDLLAALRADPDQAAARAIDLMPSLQASAQAHDPASPWQAQFDLMSAALLERR